MWHSDTLRRARHCFLIHCIGWRKNNRTDHRIYYLDTLMKTGSECIEAITRRRRILYAGFVASMVDTRLPKCVVFGEQTEGAGYVGGRETNWAGYLLDDLRAFGINADQWMTAAARQNDEGGGWRKKGGIRGGTFHSEMDHSRESQGWTTACSRIPERVGKDQGEDSPKQAWSCWFTRHYS